MITRLKQLLALFVLMLFLTGPRLAVQAGEIPDVAPETAAVETPSGTTLEGTVLFTGPVPPPTRSALKSFTECALHHKGDVYNDDALIKDGKLQNVFVYVKEGLENKTFTHPQEPKVLDQVGCIYKPHVLGIETGQELVIKNSDVSLHNVHSHSKNQQPFNIAMPVQGMKIKKTFTAPEVMIPLTCDLHPWMKSYIGVLAHPFYSVSNESGHFSIANLPPGEYTIEAWHEKFGTHTKKVSITAEAPKPIEFTFTDK